VLVHPRDGRVRWAVYTFEEDDENAHVEHESFAALLECEVSAMEATARRWHESGGYLVQVRADGSTVQHFGGRTGLPRPLDLPDQFRPSLWERLFGKKLLIALLVAFDALPLTLS
jgi:hypothetical protein